MTDDQQESRPPPGAKGLPRIGETLAFLRDPGKFYLRKREQYGEVFASNVLGMRLVSLVGRGANRWIFAGEDKYLQNQWPKAIRRLLGAQSLSMISGEAHRGRRRLLAPHFSRAGLLGQVPAIAEVVTAHFDRWVQIPGETRAVAQYKAMAFEIAARYLFGDPGAVGLDLATLSQDFDTWVAGMFSPIAVRVPLTPFARAMSARKRLFAAFSQAVQQAASADLEGDDVMRTLLRVRDDNGQPLGNDVVVDELQLLMFAGHDTTVTSLTNLMVHLSLHKDVYTKVCNEQDALAGEPLTADTLRKMVYTEQVINESMRVIPPIGGAFRQMIRDTEFAGFTIPKGWSVSVNPGISHSDPEVWEDPEVFDPDRWGPDRAEHKKAPLAFIPFGGGPRICLGQHFAMFEMKVVLALLVRGYTWRLVPGQDLDYRMIPFPRPKSGLRVLLKQR